MIAGIAIPDSALGREATEFVREASTPLLFHHSRRVFLWASLQAERLSLGYDPRAGSTSARCSTMSACSRAIARSTSASRSTGRTPPAPSSSGTACPRRTSRRSGFDTLTAEQRDAVLVAHPRANFKTGMIEAMAAGVRDKPETAVGSILTDILEEAVPGYVRPNVCDAIRNSPFET
jgi:hypothetical protein